MYQSMHSALTSVSITYPRLVEAQIRHDSNHRMLFDIEVMVWVNEYLPTKNTDLHYRQGLGEKASNGITDQLRHERSDSHTGIPHGEELVHSCANLPTVSSVLNQGERRHRSPE